jgi:molybdate transport system substrate-binding protein
MLSRFSPALVAFGGSVLLLAGLIGALYWISRPNYTADAVDPLEIYCAAAMVKTVDTIAREYEAAFGQQVIIHTGSSQAILVRMEEAKRGDLFLPADESYIHQAQKKELISDVKNVASMQAVVIVRPGFASEIKTWNDFIRLGAKIGLANPDATAIGKLTKRELQGRGLWDGLEASKPTYLGDVNEVGNNVANFGSRDLDAGITWDALAQALVERKPELTLVKLKELDGAKARVQIAIVKSTTQRDRALRFVAFLRAKDKGAVHLKRAGYSDVDEAEAMDDRRELVVYAGAMLRPALEESLTEFENREKVRITRVYNGCGILVGQMQVGELPDIYFACDTSFMSKVQDKFDAAKNVSNNQLMIVVRKGNPKQVFELTDLGKPGLRVGIGHEHQCALGALTKETFLRTGTYAKVLKNIVVQSPTGDFLVNQLFVSGQKGLDVVVAYRSNILPFPDKVDGIPITGVPCATPAQPIAVSKSSKYPELSRRLTEFLQAKESRQRFEKLGFGWEVREVDQ